MVAGNDVLNAVVQGAYEYMRRGYPNRMQLFGIMRPSMYEALEMEARARMSPGVVTAEPPLKVETSAGAVNCYPLDWLAPSDAVLVISGETRGFDRPNVVMPLVASPIPSPGSKIKGASIDCAIQDDYMHRIQSPTGRLANSEPNRQLTFEDRMRKLRGRKPKAISPEEFAAYAGVKNVTSNWPPRFTKEQLERMRESFARTHLTYAREYVNKDSEE